MSFFLTIFGTYDSSHGTITQTGVGCHRTRPVGFLFGSLAFVVSGLDREGLHGPGERSKTKTKPPKFWQELDGKDWARGKKRAS